MPDRGRATLGGGLDDLPDAWRSGAVMARRARGKFGPCGGQSGSGALPTGSEQAPSDRSTIWEFVGLLALSGVIAAEMVRACF